VGKNSLIQAVIARDPNKYVFSVSTTTRPAREGEEVGVTSVALQRLSLTVAALGGSPQ